MVKIWLKAFRLYSLPLALASVGMGTLLAAAQDSFKWSIFALTSLCTIFLQILSNLANDYGDTQHGADSSDRVGPKRTVQSGLITQPQMRHAIVIFSGLSVLAGTALLFVARVNAGIFALFFGMGIAATIAAITYTMGKRPYGYRGLGDIFVMVFFGWVGVLGTYYLQTLSMRWEMLLPASSCGLLAVGVLNINNIRDIESDVKAGKRSIPVKIGREKAIFYHWSLLISALLLAIVYNILYYSAWYQFIFVFIVAPLLFRNGMGVQNSETSASIQPYLKQLSLIALIFVLTFGVAQLFLR